MTSPLSSAPQACPPVHAQRPAARRPLALRRVTRARAALAAALAGGRHAGAVLEGAPCEVTLALPPAGEPHEPGAPALHLATRHGMLLLRPGADAWRLLTGIDLPGADEADAALRTLALNAAAARLPADWRRLLGEPSVVEGLAPPSPAGDDAGALMLQVAPAGAAWRFVARLEGAASALSALAAAAPWQAGAPRALPEARLRVRVPVALGRLRLAPRTLRSLRAGDVLLPRRPRFHPDGAGVVRLGPCCLAGVLDAAGGFRFERWSADPMDDHSDEDDDTLAHDAADALAHDAEPPDDGLIDPDADPDVDPDADLDADPDADPDADLDAAPRAPSIDPPIEALPLTLTIELGVLELSVAQVRALAPGQVLALERPLPAQARLVCGGIELARGELVELEGRLGLEIAALAPAAKAPA